MFNHEDYFLSFLQIIVKFHKKRPLMNNTLKKEEFTNKNEGNTQKNSGI